MKYDYIVKLNKNVKTVYSLAEAKKVAFEMCDKAYFEEHSISGIAYVDVIKDIHNNDGSQNPVALYTGVWHNGEINWLYTKL